jgi:hypothetical protein
MRDFENAAPHIIAIVHDPLIKISRALSVFVEWRSRVRLMPWFAEPETKVRMVVPG